ncbi:unnamed protein product [Rotaria sp. Silwood1]|nr:unnamed protein product [Rotaria sp. Silwood1]
MYEGEIKLSDSVRSQNSESKSDKSIIQHIFSTKFLCKTLEEFIGIDNMIINDPTEDFKNTIDAFVKISKTGSENETSLEFDNHLKKFNSQITYTGNQKGGEFEQIFRDKQPDFTWSITTQFYAWNIVTIIEKTKNDLTRNEISQMLEYLRMIVQISPERTYAIGCLTNYKDIIFGKATIINNKFNYEIFESENVIKDYWKFLHCNPIYLGHVKFSIPENFQINLLLGRGAVGMVYQIEYQNIQYAMKISNKKSTKEYEIAEKMKNYINEHSLSDVKIMNMFNIQGFILSRPVGKLMDENQLCQKKYITQIFKQLAIGHKLGLVHRDIRIYNLILFNDEDVYLIDWDSSTCNGFNGEYEGSFLTASTSVLAEYELTRGKQVSAYYADDCLSIIYMLLLFNCTKEEKIRLKKLACESSAGILIIARKKVLQRYPKEAIDCLDEIEQKRASLINIDDLHNQCQQIINKWINLT